MSCQSSPFVAQFFTTSDVVEITRLSDTEAVFETGAFSDPIFVQLFDASALTGPVFIDWTLVAVDGLAVGFGLHLQGAGLLGDGVVNLLYMASGYVINDGVVDGNAPAVRVGDTVRLWLDPGEGRAAFYLNGVEVY